MLRGSAGLRHGVPKVKLRVIEFSAHRVFTDDGCYESEMIDPDGGTVKDRRNAWFSPSPWAPPAIDITPMDSQSVATEERPQFTERPTPTRLENVMF